MDVSQAFVEKYSTVNQVQQISHGNPNIGV